jgi:hypothetical protein
VWLHRAPTPASSVHRAALPQLDPEQRPRQCEPGPSASDHSTLRGPCLQNVTAALFSGHCCLLYKVPAKSLPGTLLAGGIRGFNVHSRRIVPMPSQCIDWPCRMY